MAADVDEQRRVVHDCPRLLVEPEPQRDQALPQHMLHGLSETEIDPERERCQDFGQTDARAIRSVGHAAQPKRRDRAARAEYLPNPRSSD